MTRRAHQKASVPAFTNTRPPPLRYALITGRGQRRVWCLLHPNADAALASFRRVQRWPAERLGAAHLDPAGFSARRNTLKGHRAPLGVLRHTEWSDVVVKGSEADLNFEDRLAERNGPSPLRPEDARLAQENALWISRAAIMTGVPVIPVHRAVTTDEMLGALQKATRAEGVARTFWSHAGQLLTVQAYVTVPEDACDVLSRTLLGWDEFPEHIGQWLEQLGERLDVFETVAGAPDRHRNSRLSVPVLLPDGNLTDVTHGIDYEWIAPEGLLTGSDRPLKSQLSRLKKNLQPWERQAILDVTSQARHWDRPPQ